MSIQRRVTAGVKGQDTDRSTPSNKKVLPAQMQYRKDRMDL